MYMYPLPAEWINPEMKVINIIIFRVPGGGWGSLGCPGLLGEGPGALEQGQDVRHASCGKHADGEFEWRKNSGVGKNIYHIYIYISGLLSSVASFCRPPLSLSSPICLVSTLLHISDWRALCRSFACEDNLRHPLPFVLSLLVP